MSYERHYVGNDEAALDEQAIADIREYLTAEQWGIMMKLVADPTATIGHINMALAFAGVSGRPFHAFCRRYMLDKYREWMASTAGGEPVQTDERGFRLQSADAPAVQETGR